VEANIYRFAIVCLYVSRLEIHLSGGESWDHINQFNPVTLVYLSQVRTWICNVICCGLFMFNESMSVVFVRGVEIGGIMTDTV
jgi:hypothetical protein